VSGWEAMQQGAPDYFFAEQRPAELQQRTDRLYAEMTPKSRLLPAERPWLYRISDLVRLSDGETVQILDGFLHIRRAVGGRLPTYAPAGSKVIIIRAVSEGSSL
jgi:hypothetical protein